MKTLALDVEGTLISNAVSQFPRPGLHEFLEFSSAAFAKVVVYTGVEEVPFRRVASQLVLEGSAPEWFADVPHLHWSGEYKDLLRIPDTAVNTTWIVDDLEDCIRPDQKGCWIPIAPFDPPYPATDAELKRVKEVLTKIVASRT